MSILFLLTVILLIGVFFTLRRAEMRLSALEARVKVLEARDGTLSEAPVADAIEAVTEDAAEPPLLQPVAPEAVDEPAIAARVDDEAVAETAAAATPARPRESLESMIGARWPVWVGGIALALGGIFMVRYSIEQGLISPAVRLAMAFLFGLLLLGLGEWVRRRQKSLDLPAIRNALVPGALTAAGVVTLFGAVYAAYAVYDYLGEPSAFILLALVSLATLALSLLHGQALAGLGLLAAMATPALIDTDAPSAWGLFGYLAIAWLATMAAARIRGWNAVPALANFFLLGWSTIFIADAPDGDMWAVVMCMFVMAAGFVFLWPAGDGEDVANGQDEKAPATGWRAWYRQAAGGLPHRAIRWTGGLTLFSVAMLIVAFGDFPHGTLVKTALVVFAFGFWGAWRRAGVSVPLFALAAIVMQSIATAGGDLFFDTGDPLQGGLFGGGWSFASGLLPVFFAWAAGFVLLGIVALFRHAGRAPAYAALWVFLSWVAPLSLLTATFLAFGNFTFDWPHGLAGLVLAIVFLGLAEQIWRKGTGGDWRHLLVGGLATGSFLSVVLALHAFTQSVVTTILVAVAGFAYLMGIRRRPWPALPWLMGLAAIVVLARIGWQPSLVGDLALSRTPFFNQLLPGYGIPAILTALGAYLLKDWPDVRVRNFLQALASLLGLMTVAILVRHAMNGGVLSGNLPTLGEQSIYTLLTVGGSAVLMTLDMRAPSPVFRWGSMLVGGLSMLFALGAHLFTLNPYFSGELVGARPFFNLLLLGYLLPSLAFFGLAYYARGKRPAPYVKALTLAGAVLVFAWVTLSVRQFWQGAGIADWKGFEQGEMYTYSVVWLILGVGLLAAGSRFHAKSLRTASGGLVLIAVLKVFLVDMSNLEGILRALSFIGLGAVLIGIGLFYQRVLRSGAPAEENGLPASGGGDTPA